jgi:hypothetical protein
VPVPDGLGEGDALTEGDGLGDGAWLGLTLDASGVGTGGTGHRQLGAAATAGAGVPGTAAGRFDGGTVPAVRGAAAAAVVGPTDGVGEVAPDPGGFGAASGADDSTLPSPAVTPKNVATTNTATPSPSPTAPTYRRRGARWYASYSGCSTSVRRRDSGTGRVTS